MRNLINSYLDVQLSPQIMLASKVFGPIPSLWGDRAAACGYMMPDQVLHDEVLLSRSEAAVIMGYEPIELHPSERYILMSAAAPTKYGSLLVPKTRTGNYFSSDYKEWGNPSWPHAHLNKVWRDLAAVSPVFPGVFRSQHNLELLPVVWKLVGMTHNRFTLRTFMMPSHDTGCLLRIKIPDTQLAEEITEAFKRAAEQAVAAAVLYNAERDH